MSHRSASALRYACVAGLAALYLGGCARVPGEGVGAPPPAAAVSSAPLALAPGGKALWVVNPDADSLTRVDVSDPHMPVASSPLPVGGEPWAVAVAPNGDVVVMNRRDGTLTFVESRGDGWEVADGMYVGPEPGGLVLSEDGGQAYVTVSADAVVAVVDVAARAVVARVPVGPLPWAAARSGETLIVAHRLARHVPGEERTSDVGREGWLTLVDLAGLGDEPGGAAVTEVPLAANAYGFPNALEGLAVTGDTVYVAHQLNSPEPPNDFQTSVSGGLSAVALGAAAAPAERALDLNDPGFSTPTNFPRAVAAAPGGEALYVALSGSAAVMGIDVTDPAAPQLLGFWPTGLNPRGIVISADGRTGFVMNHLSRDVSVLDLDDASLRREVARVTVAPETLTPETIRGKVLFNDAKDPRLSRNGWMSCASCHLDGGGDGTSWPREEGVRQTMPLWALAGTAPFHAAATRDELQDFEVDIERFMAGVGLAPGPAGSLLGAPSAGLSPDLDALASFVLHGMRVPAAPTSDPQAVERGRALFVSRSCSSCHAGPAWTISSLPGPVGTLAPGGEDVVLGSVHDVGTFDPERDVTGEHGFDVPTLLGIAHTAPYFHDGSAATLGEVLAHPGHSGGPFSEDEERDLVAFLRSIDAATEPFDLP